MIRWFISLLTIVRIPGCLLGALLLALGCDTSGPTRPQDWARLRARMVAEQLKTRDINNERVLAAMARVPRHEFVPRAVRNLAYRDHPLEIGHEQTISQPYMVALMTQLIDPKPSQRVLEVGTGSGYQAAVLAELVKKVYTIELVPELAKQAAERLKGLGYNNVQVGSGDGYQGWPEAAPFDAIVVTCAPEHIPEPLLEQLEPGGKMVIPVGATPDSQTLQVISKTAEGVQQTRKVTPVRFVPLRRAHGDPGR
jgi:protein-L-isoaspartate(D-aspartate) O-methyltransferase